MSDGNTSVAPGQLSDDHRAFLTAQAVDVALAEKLGVRSLMERGDTKSMGGHWGNWANVPAIAFPWTSPDGRVEWQVRPDDPTGDSKGKLRKYVFHMNMTPVLWAVREVEKPKRIVIIEGTKQGLAGASYAPADTSVYAIAGCRMWQTPGGGPIPDLGVVEDLPVVVILDADAADNLDVYQAGVELTQALAAEGATEVKFARLTGGKNGLDDVLGGRAENKRATFLARLIDTAKPKPADKVPSRKKKPGNTDTTPSNGRVRIVVNRDRYDVINDMTKALLDRWNAKTLFNHGGVISRRQDDGSMSPVDRGSFHDLVQETAVTISENEGAQGVTESFSWPDSGTMSAVMSKARMFSPLERISHAPFVRPDGSIVVEPGYDEATRTLLVPDEVFAGIEVPETPTAAEVEAARKLLLEEWLGDFPVDSDADRANLMALLVTPAIRGLCPKVPLAVIDGLQMGVGKNLLVDSLLTVYTGEAARPMNWVSEPEELRKQITSAFRTGVEFFVFDEAHTLEGAPLAQALTAETWQDRILGVSTMAEFPNRVTWISMGNQVQVRGDITRRVYRIALRPKYANPQDRKSSTFRHPDLGSWTRANRRELMVAILTIVRAWFGAGQPYPARGVSFGSFEVWEKITGGIVEAAGLPGFLDNLKVWRSESDFDTQYWLGHLRWLREKFGDIAFRTAMVKEAAQADPAGFMAPPKLDDPADKGFSKALGEAYSRMRERRMDGLWMERVSSAHGNVSLWVVREDSEQEPPPVVEPDPEPTPDPNPPTWDGKLGCSLHGGVALAGGPNDPAWIDCAPDVCGHEPDPAHTPEPEPEADDTSLSIEAGLITLDLETGDAGDLYKHDGGEYVRLAGVAVDDGPVLIKEGAEAARLGVNAVRSAEVLTGHNIMAFDLPALVRNGGLTMPEVHTMAEQGRLFDAMIAARFVNPPMAREKGVDASRRYDLGALLDKYDLGEKLKDLSKELAKKYDGWWNIPTDDQSEDGLAFRRYLDADVTGSRRLHAKLLDELGGTMPEYLVREHRVAALAAQISVNGFKVDRELLAERVTEVEARKAEAMGLLSSKYGIPTADGKGKAYKSPLASKAGKEALAAALVAAGVPERGLIRTPNSGDLQTSGETMLYYGREFGQGRPELGEILKTVYRIVGSRSVYQTIQDHTGPDGRVHPKVAFKQVTGRWSVTEPGLTVLGKRGGRHVERAVLLPDEGEVLISADLSQVDMRAVAGLSQDKAYIEMLLAEDPHAEIAHSLFGDRSMRELAKPIGHGWNYGRGIKAISEGNNIDPAIVRRFDQSMRERFPRLVEWQTEVRALAESGAMLDNGFGRMMRPDPQRAHTQGPALMGQGAARDIMMTGMLRLPAEILPMLRAQIHDEIVLSVPADQAEEIGREVVKALSFDWNGVPILADVSKTGTDWSLCYAK